MFSIGIKEYPFAVVFDEATIAERLCGPSAFVNRCPVRIGKDFGVAEANRLLPMARDLSSYRNVTWISNVGAVEGATPAVDGTVVIVEQQEETTVFEFVQRTRGHRVQNRSSPRRVT